MNDQERVKALFGALSIALSACTPQVRPTANDPEIAIPVAPAPSASAASDPVGLPPPAASSAPSAVASDAPPAPSATATASVTAKKPLVIKKGRPRVVEGRPFLVEGAARLASAGAHAGWADAIDLEGKAPSREERAALIAHYTDWALAEHASIASFARFALQLLALGAPSHLVARATEAIADETRHARFGFGLVRALGGSTVGPGALSIERALADESLEDVLRLVVREGMIGETLAALEVSAAADLAEPRWLKRALATIAAEESRHAELAYVFAAWALGRDPKLAALVDQEVNAWDRGVVPAATGLERWGILDAGSRERLRDLGFTNAVVPLVRQLRA
jgi:hypothetical protein